MLEFNYIYIIYDSQNYCSNFLTLGMAQNLHLFETFLKESKFPFKFYPHEYDIAIGHRGYNFPALATQNSEYSTCFLHCFKNPENQSQFSGY